MDNLTLVLPLKDREFYSRRLLGYLDEICCPYPLIIADGGAKDSKIQQSIESNYYDNLEYEYIRFPYDSSPQQFYGKIANSLLKVETPLAMMIDNDDFFTINGLDFCTEFLRNNNDFISARGGMTGVHIGERGIIEREDMYTKFPDSIVGDTAQERIQNQATHFHSNWHNITRTHALQTNWSIIWYFSPTNLRFCEQTIGFLNIVWGGGLRDASFCHIIHQHDTPRVEGGEREVHFPDQDTWIRDKEWSYNFSGMTDAIALAINMCEGIDFEDCRQEFRKSYMDMYVPRISNRDLLVSKIEDSKSYCSDRRIEDIKSIISSLNPFGVGYISEKDVPSDINEACEKEIEELQNFLRTMS